MTVLEYFHPGIFTRVEKEEGEEDDQEEEKNGINTINTTTAINSYNDQNEDEKSRLLEDQKIYKSYNEKREISMEVNKMEERFQEEGDAFEMNISSDGRE